MKKFLDQAGLVALWAKIKSHVATYVSSYVGNAKLLIKGDSTTTKQVITMNEGTDRTFQIKGDGTWITGTVGGSDNSATLTVAHGGPSTGSAMTTTVGTPSTYQPRDTVTVVNGVTVSADTKGHITGVSTSRSTLKMPGDANFTIQTKVGSTETDIITYNANEDSDDGELTIEQGSNIILTPDAINKKITIAAVATAPNDSTLTLVGDSGSQQIFSADDDTNRTLTVHGGRDVETTVTTENGGVKLTVDHDVMNSSAGNITQASSSTNTSVYLAGGELLSGIELTHTNGHITGITSTYKRIGKATQLYDGLMSAADKIALDNINTTISTALTSAITPSGSVTAQQFADLVQAQNTILSSTGLGNLYTLTTPLVLGPTQTGDVSLLYSYFVEGYSVTNNGAIRYEIPAGTNLLIVNTGTPQNPVYQVDMVGTYDNSYWNHNELKAIPVDTSDEDYEAGDDTIDSICV